LTSLRKKGDSNKGTGKKKVIKKKESLERKG